MKKIGIDGTAMESMSTKKLNIFLCCTLYGPGNELDSSVRGHAKYTDGVVYTCTRNFTCDHCFAYSFTPSAVRYSNR